MYTYFTHSSFVEHGKNVNVFKKKDNSHPNFIIERIFLGLLFDFQKCVATPFPFSANFFFQRIARMRDAVLNFFFCFRILITLKAFIHPEKKTHTPVKKIVEIEIPYGIHDQIFPLINVTSTFFR